MRTAGDDVASRCELWCSEIRVVGQGVDRDVDDRGVEDRHDRADHDGRGHAPSPGPMVSSVIAGS